MSPRYIHRLSVVPFKLCGNVFRSSGHFTLMGISVASHDITVEVLHSVQFIFKLNKTIKSKRTVYPNRLKLYLIVYLPFHMKNGRWMPLILLSLRMFMAVVMYSTCTVHELQLVHICCAQ